MQSVVCSGRFLGRVFFISVVLVMAALKLQLITVGAAGDRDAERPVPGGREADCGGRHERLQRHHHGLRPGPCFDKGQEYKYRISRRKESKTDC